MKQEVPEKEPTPQPTATTPATTGETDGPQQSSKQPLVMATESPYPNIRLSPGVEGFAG